MKKFYEISFVKLNRSVETRELQKDPFAFTLLSVIAERAQRGNRPNIHNLSVGEAEIGDFKSYGMTRGQYREATKRLIKWGFATIRTTNKGTVARLINTAVFDPNLDEEQPASPPSNSHPATNKQPLPRSKEEKNAKKVGEESSAFPHLLKALADDPTPQNAIAAIREAHPAFSGVPEFQLTNSLAGQPDRSKWAEAISGMAAKFAGANLPTPNQTLQNWLAGKPSAASNQQKKPSWEEA